MFKRRSCGTATANKIAQRHFKSRFFHSRRFSNADDRLATLRQTKHYINIDHVAFKINGNAIQLDVKARVYRINPDKIKISLTVRKKIYETEFENFIVTSIRGKFSALFIKYFYWGIS